MNVRRLPVIVAAIGLTLAACGTSDAQSSTEPADTDALAPAISAGDEASDEASDATSDPVDAESVTTDPPPATDVAGTEEPVAVEPAASEPADTTAAPAEPEPAPAEIGGRVLAAEVDPASQFEGNPFPDLVVDDVGRRGSANLANVLPSDRPILLWAWAPH
ncbi:hypothetical protein [Ilumatobacter sp.]|uniref:hypothetical protein n=1 Tax=Ilumatobacter sp. TaxID=1967498 RepID=UPI003C65574F